ncbi:hypothetical protein ACJX0J_011306, partial [Zea mays]
LKRKQVKRRSDIDLDKIDLAIETRPDRTNFEHIDGLALPIITYPFNFGLEAEAKEKYSFFFVRFSMQLSMFQPLFPIEIHSTTKLICFYFSLIFAVHCHAIYYILFSFIACETFTCEIDIIMRTLVEDVEHISLEHFTSQVHELHFVPFIFLGGYILMIECLP